MQHTLSSLAIALRGMPRQAAILVKLPDGRLLPCITVTGALVARRDDGIEATPGAGGGAEYAIVFEIEQTVAG